MGGKITCFFYTGGVCSRVAAVVLARSSRVVSGVLLWPRPCESKYFPESQGRRAKTPSQVGTQSTAEESPTIIVDDMRLGWVTDRPFLYSAIETAGASVCCSVAPINQSINQSLPTTSSGVK